jgi:hypothetical protein
MRKLGDIKQNDRVEVCLPKTVAVSLLSVPSTINNLIGWTAMSIPVLGTILLFRLSDGNIVFKSADRVVEVISFFAKFFNFTHQSCVVRARQ